MKMSPDKNGLVKVFCLAMVSALTMMSIGGSKNLPVRLDVTAQPEGAMVSVDDIARGVAPVSIFDLEPGRHLVHVQAPSHTPVDEFVVLSEDAFIQKTYSLTPEKALVLLQTQPKGAEVKYNGVSLGTTPLLLTTLASGRTYSLELSLNGYQTKKVDVAPEGRTPLVREEVLPLDSGVVSCTTEPDGATVIVNGVERGVTPVELTNIPKGLATITVRLAGYREETRELRLVPGDRQSLALKLKGLPGRMTVVSSPERAQVFLDNDFQGKTPVTISQVEPGAHELRVELPGHASQSRKVDVEKGAAMTEEFKMESVLGRLEIVTIPAGAKVSVDGKAVGTTKSQGGDAMRSRVLSVEKVAAGDHSVLIHLDGYQDVLRKVRVQSKQAGTLFVRLSNIFMPDTEVETVTGTQPYRGVLISNGADGLVLETKPGIRQTFRQEDIRKVTPLSSDK